MYQDHFNLTDLPFENTPNPAFFYGGGQYRECLSAMLHYVANRRGIMGLSGPIGVGKTTLIHTLRRVLPENTKVITMIHPESSPLELLTYVAQGLNLETMPESKLQAVEVVQSELIRLDLEGGVCLLIVDEAQLLTPELLEQLRLLSNLETETHKLIQVILVGQPELVNILSLPELAAVRQRVSLMKVLSALTPEESLYYIAHRLSRAGSGLELFSDQALKTVVGYSGGIPRIINQLCEGALVSAFGAERHTVAVEDVEEAAANLLLLGEKMIISRPTAMDLPEAAVAEPPTAPKTTEAFPEEPVTASPPGFQGTEPDFLPRPEDTDRTGAPDPSEALEEPEPELEPEPEPQRKRTPFLSALLSRKAPEPERDYPEPAPPPPDEEEEDLTPGRGLPSEIVFETETGEDPPRPERSIPGRAKPLAQDQFQDQPQEPLLDQEPGLQQPLEEKSDPEPEGSEEPKGNLEWSPPPPVPAPEDDEPKISILRPMVILAACLIIISAGIGFYLTWYQKSSQKTPEPTRQSTITAPVKPGEAKQSTD